MTFDQHLDAINVLAPTMVDVPEAPPGWYAVCDETGVVAYFANEVDACGFRLWLVNARTNGVEAARLRSEDAA